MKGKTLLSFMTAAVICNSSFSQGVGINTDGGKPDSSAMLDIKNVNKGFLPPRVFLLNRRDTTTIKKPATGLLVYNTNKNINGNGCCPGIYMYTGSGWSRLTTDIDDTLTTAIFTPSGNTIRQTTNQRFQTFTATQSGTLLSVALYTTGLYGGIGTRPVKLYEGSGNTGTLLATLTLPGNFTGSVIWEKASPPADPINIYAGLTYTIETNEKLWVLQGGNPYLGGYSNSLDPSEDYGVMILIRN